MFFNLVLLFTVIPALELFLLFRIGALVGGMNTFAIIIMTGVIGAALAKSQGIAIAQNVQKQLAKGEIPANEMIQGLLVLGGGLLLLTPGFLTDILGFSMVLPGTRWILARMLKKYFMEQQAKGNSHFAFHTYSFSSGSSRPNTKASKIDEDTFEVEFTKESD